MLIRPAIVSVVSVRRERLGLAGVAQDHTDDVGKKALDRAEPALATFARAMAHRPTPPGHPPRGPRLGQRGLQASGPVFRFSVTSVQAGAGAVWRETSHMARQKKLKKTVRALSRKDGESYTAARRHVLEARHHRTGATVSGAAPKAPPTLAPSRT